MRRNFGTFGRFNCFVIESMKECGVSKIGSRHDFGSRKTVSYANIVPSRDLVQIVSAVVTLSLMNLCSVNSSFFRRFFQVQIMRFGLEIDGLIVDREKCSKGIFVQSSDFSIVLFISCLFIFFYVE